VEDFAEWMRVHNYSDRTVTDRIYYLTKFVDWSLERGLSHANEITPAILERYQHHLYNHRKTNGEPLSFRSQRFRLSPVLGFFKWMTRQRLILMDPASAIELPREERRLPRSVPTEREVETILSQPDLKDSLGVRDRAIMETLYSTGIRRMELINLRVDDLDRDRETVLIRQGKGKRDRVVPIGDRALAWIDRYTQEIRPELVAGPDHQVLFLTIQGGPFHQTHLTQMVRGYVEKAKVTKPGACHLFRHAMATVMLENGADIRHIQEILGHADLSTTQVYTHLSIGRLKEVHQRTHPAQLKGNKGRKRSRSKPDVDPTNDYLGSLDAESEDE